MRAIDVTNQRFGRLTAMARDRSSSGRHTKWLCRCDCGAETSVFLDALRRGASTSCGCLRSEQTQIRSLTHGHQVNRRASRTLKSYRHAKSRCLNPSDQKYPLYGGRGIRMCNRWLNSFENFLSDMGECPPGLTLDRIDVNGDYEPGNCRWASNHTQSRNKTTNVFVHHDGADMILKDFATEMGVNYKSLHSRIKYSGQSAHEAAEELRSRTSA